MLSTGLEGPLELNYWWHYPHLLFQEGEAQAESKTYVTLKLVIGHAYG